MRDDLHKGAPVPRCWKSLIRHCSRDADWLESGPPAAERAVLSLCGELRAHVLQEVQAVVCDSQLALQDHQALDVLKVRCRVSTLESAVIDEVKARLGVGPKLLELDGVLASSIHDALAGASEGYLRAAEAHIQVKSPKNTRELLSRMAESIKKAPLDSMAAKLSQGAPLKPSLSRPVLDIHNDDIGAPLVKVAGVKK